MGSLSGTILNVYRSNSTVDIMGSNVRRDIMALGADMPTDGTWV